MKKYLILVLTLACNSSGEPKPLGNTQKALYEDDEFNCGAEGYECVGGRTCIDSVCTPAWIEMEDDGAPSARGYASAASLDGKYMMMGGCDSTSPSSALDDVYIYDLSNDTWSVGPTLDTGRSNMASLSTDSGVFLFGGLTVCHNGTYTNSDLSILFSLSDSWSQAPITNAPSARYSTSLSLVEGIMSVYGGSDGTNPSLATGRTLKIGGSWEDITCPLSGCERGGAYLTFGGDGVVHVLSDSGNLIYDIGNDQWYDWVGPDSTPTFSTMSNGNHPSYGDDGRRLYILSQDDTIRIYDRVSQAWVTDSSTPPTGFSYMAAAAWVGRELVAWGGFDGMSLYDVGGRYQPPAPTE